MKKNLLLFFCLICSVISARASHIMGGDITVSPTGLPGSYRVKVVFYRDILGIAAGPNITCQLYSGISPNFTGLSSFQLPLDPLQSGMAVPNFPYGVEVYTYEGLVGTNLSAGPYRIAANHCCRNGAIMNADQGEETFVADFTIPAASINTTPEFLAMPVVYASINQPWTYNPVPYDADGDSLSWAITTPYGTLDIPTGQANLTTNWVLPPADPSGPFTLSPYTGELSWTPSTLGNFIAAFTITEYKNGIATGSINRDMQYVIVQGSQSWPIFVPGNNYSVNTQQGYNWTTYASGQPFQFKIQASGGSSAMKIECISGLFKKTVPPTFSYAPVGSGIEGTFDWTPPASQLKDEIVVFRLRDGAYAKDFTLLLRKGSPAAVAAIPQPVTDLRVYPNPAGKSLNISLKTAENMPLSLQLVDAAGRRVQSLFEGEMKRGTWNMQFDMNCANGIYLLQASSGGKVISARRVSVSK